MADLASVIDTQRELSFLVGPPGHEQPVADFVLARIGDLVDEAWTDGLGSVLAIKAGTNKDGRRIMVDAHLDEVGFVLSHLEEGGFARFGLLGSIREPVLSGALVQLQSDGDPVYGIVGHRPPHLSERAPGSERQAVAPPQVDAPYIDFGLSDAALHSRGVRVGSVGSFYTPFLDLGEGRLAGKAFDDRTGCNVLIHVLEELRETPIADTVVVSFSAQEEIGGMGARVAANTLQPQAAIVLENTTAHDVPGVAPHQRVAQLGGGPAITVADQTTVVPRSILEWLVGTAKELQIPWQYKTPRVGSTNAAAVVTGHQGIPTGVVSVPSRYIHGPAALIDVADVMATIALVSACLRG